jgi:alkanesulfonate monooxygenase SsuD/methylene tetrahydromethanopterin reductase-like flavin-dependent oxidoreductase (luciferase family)
MPEKQPLWFGLNIDPGVNGIDLAFDLAQYADINGVDLVGIQDHPYNPDHLDTWTLMAALGARTSHTRIFSNVLNLPLRPAPMLAKAAATLDVLTQGRVVLGLGAGALWDAVAGYGGPHREAGEAVDALEEAIAVMRKLWGSEGAGPQQFAGTYYRLADARPGPLPIAPIPIWLGALKPRMVALTGRLADGWSISYNWVPPEQAVLAGKQLDEAAEAAGRPPTAIRRNYNLMGLIEGAGQPSVRLRQGMLGGTPQQWAEQITRFIHDLRMDTFTYWPVAGDVRTQMRLWTEEVVPLVREHL